MLGRTGCRRRNGVIRVGPVQPTQIVQRDHEPHATGNRDDRHERDRPKEERALNPRPRSKPEVDDRDRNGNGNPVRDDPERPRVPMISLVDEPARRTSIAGRQPALEDGAHATVWTTSTDPVLQRNPRVRAFVRHARRQCEGRAARWRHGTLCYQAFGRRYRGLGATRTR